MNDADARFAARLQVVLHHTDEVGDPAPLRALHRETAATLGGGAPLTLLVECALQETLSLSRPAAESRAAWRELRHRADHALAPAHTTLMSIRAYQERYERRSGRPDPDRYRAEWSRRVDTLGRDDYRTRIAHANVAFALRERGTDDDLAESERVLHDEIGHRVTHYGPDDLFTWQARGLLALTLMDRGDTGAAVTLATGLVEARRRRLSRFHPLTLRAHVLRAQTLTAAGDEEEAAAEVRYLRASLRRRRAAIDDELVELIEALSR